MDTTSIGYGAMAASEIARVELTLGLQLKDLNGRVAAGRNDVETDRLLKRCRETADSLLIAVEALGQGTKANVLRVIADHLLLRLGMLERDYGPVRLH